MCERNIRALKRLRRKASAEQDQIKVMRLMTDLAAWQDMLIRLTKQALGERVSKKPRPKPSSNKGLQYTVPPALSNARRNVTRTTNLVNKLQSEVQQAFMKADFTKHKRLSAKVSAAKQRLKQYTKTLKEMPIQTI